MRRATDKPGDAHPMAPGQHAIFRSAPVGIVVTQPDRISTFNPRLGQIFGYSEDELDTLTPMQVFASLEAYHELVGEAMPVLASGGMFEKNELQLQRRDGSTFWARLRGCAVDPGNRAAGTVWMLEDRTREKLDADALQEAAAALRRARDELERRVAERTAELEGANAQLQEEINERRLADERAQHLAYHDTLTGLPNRALLAQRLNEAIRVAGRAEGGKMAVMFLDLDHFKNINDSLGHMIGDRLLQNVAVRLVGAASPGATVARLGGDEFVLLLPKIKSNAECRRIAQRIIDALSSACRIERQSLYISPSIGISIYPDDGQDVDTLLRHADAAMYQAKAAGRNNYQFYTMGLNQDAARRFALESSLRGALARHEFELHYQPIMCSQSRRVRALEVLLRWRTGATEDEPGKVVGPDEFVPILEETGMIVAVGEWVIRSACAQNMTWQRAGLAVVPLAINLSARQFMHRGLVDSIRAIVQETGIDPALVEFEITETALMQHGSQTLAILRQINAMGMRLSIDDFGTGYSSLAYLKRFPVHKIKIDRAFVRDLENSVEDRAIVAAVMALANSLQLSVVAEGVETEGQHALLQSFGCQYAQGYLFARPLPASSVKRLLAR